MTDWERRDWHDLGYTALARVNEYGVAVDWYVVAIAATSVWDSERGNVPVAFGNMIDEWGDDPREHGEVVLDGAVKWDGCSNWTVGSPDVMLHFCGFDAVEQFAAMLRRVYEVTPWMLGQHERQVQTDLLPSPVEHPSQAVPDAR